jgi:hypothetical protein
MLGDIFAFTIVGAFAVLIFIVILTSLGMVDGAALLSMP